MKVIECPSCQSKFKVNEAALQKETVKLRCSVCSHVFTLQSKAETSLEQEFESLLSGDEKKPRGEDFELEETPPMPEPPQTEGPTSPTPFSPDQANIAAQPESVIREIDSILGAGEEIGTYKPVEIESEEERRPQPRYWVWGVLAVVIVAIGLGAYVSRERLPFLRDLVHRSSGLERGPFFEIPDNGITYEIVNNQTEGTALVVKGLVKKLAPRPLKSLLVEVRMYDRNKSLIATKMAYAGILPEREEFISKRQDDIDALLSAEPQSLGVLTMADEIPFAVAFFGKPAQEGVSFQVEVREYRWQ